jgi:hypothetical protein
MVKKFKDIVRKNPEPAKGKFGIDPTDPWSVKYGIAEGDMNEDLRKWFKQKWVRMDTKGNIKGDCAREPGEGKPKCLPQAKAQAIGKEARASAAQRKRREDPDPERHGKPINVRTEEIDIDESAAAVIAAATAISKKKSGNYDSKGFRKTPYKNPNHPLRKSNAEREKEMNEDETNEACWDRYKQVGMKKKSNRMVPDCVPEEVEQIEEKNVPTSPEKWARAKAAAKSKFAVYPSAYANGWASKKYKAMGGGWKSVSEATDKKDRVILDIPLLIRVLELAREDIKTDMDLHRVVEKLIQIRNKGVLTMKDYNTIAHIRENHIAIAMGKMLDDEGSMVLGQLEQLERAITMIRTYVGKDYEKQLPAWVQSKITLATDYADTVGNYLISKNEKVTKESLDEAQSKRMSGADKFRKYLANRDKKHAEFMKSIENKPHGEQMQAMMDKIRANLNKEEVELDEAKRYPYKFRATYHDPDTNEVTHYMDFTHRNLDAAKKHAQGSRLQRRDGKQDKLHSVVQMKEEVEELDELNYDTVKSLYQKRRADFHGAQVGKKKKGKEVSAKNVSTSISRLMGHKPTQNQPVKEENCGCPMCRKTEMSKSARMIKSLYKKHNMKEDMTDFEKEDKSVQTYGKKPKIQTTPKKDSFGEDKPKAAIIMSGGKTMTGQNRDTVEIDPMLKKRPGPDDFDRNYGKKQPQ